VAIAYCTVRICLRAVATLSLATAKGDKLTVYNLNPVFQVNGVLFATIEKNLIIEKVPDDKNQPAL
jgi:hypothetical protein